MSEQALGFVKYIDLISATAVIHPIGGGPDLQVRVGNLESLSAPGLSRAADEPVGFEVREGVAHLTLDPILSESQAADLRGRDVLGAPVWSGFKPRVFLDPEAMPGDENFLVVVDPEEGAQSATAERSVDDFAQHLDAKVSHILKLLETGRDEAAPGETRKWPRVRPLEPELPGTGEQDGLQRVRASVARSDDARRGYHAQRAVLAFGAWLRAQREARGMTLKQLAGKAATTVSQLSLVERGLGERGPSLDLVARLLWALDLGLDFGEPDNAADE
ncbi:helix-turn-helix transcriptional regulator [Breoghania sp. L-A4]|uniref:helix-turn-helix domain-containing protein n=1 Tax=Breoghania sp. L-A4 TaxID=2304600 RepID=UPI000E36083B|nr:helix-turn-helix transcriptional regulator [Breoghania sp. L-A4]AXS41154.1 XRE family transcriptional regulator [Breoghania sp. L-A4]